MKYLLPQSALPIDRPSLDRRHPTFYYYELRSLQWEIDTDTNTIRWVAEEWGDEGGGVRAHLRRVGTRHGTPVPLTAEAVWCAQAWLLLGVDREIAKQRAAIDALVTKRAEIEALVRAHA